MNIFLKTSFGTSSTFYSGAESLPFQVSCQCNGAAPMLWSIIIDMIIRNMCLKGLASQYYNPISRSVFSLATLLHVDNTNLNVLNLSHEYIFEVVL